MLLAITSKFEQRLALVGFPDGLASQDRGSMMVWKSGMDMGNALGLQSYHSHACRQNLGGLERCDDRAFISPAKLTYLALEFTLT
jgi:hypothetical protein